MASTLTVWLHIGDLTSSIDAYLLEEQSCHISSRSDLKRPDLRFFRRTSPNKNMKKMMSSDIRSVPDLEMRPAWNQKQAMITKTVYWCSQYQDDHTPCRYTAAAALVAGEAAHHVLYKMPGLTFNSKIGRTSMSGHLSRHIVVTRRAIHGLSVCRPSHYCRRHLEGRHSANVRRVQ